MKKHKILWTSLLLFGAIGGVVGLSSSLVSCSSGGSGEQVVDPTFPSDVTCNVIVGQSVYQPSDLIRPLFSETDLNKMIDNNRTYLEKKIAAQKGTNGSSLYVDNYISHFGIKNDEFMIDVSYSELRKFALDPNKPKVKKIVKVKTEISYHYNLKKNPDNTYNFHYIEKTGDMIVDNVPMDIPEHLKNQFGTTDIINAISLEELTAQITGLYNPSKE